MLCRNLFDKRDNPSGRLRLVVLGSTGSIGESALELCRRYPEHFEVLALSAYSNATKLSLQVQEFRPKYVVLGQEQERNRIEVPRGTQLFFGSKALCEIAALEEADVVLAAIVGVACLEPVLSALRSGKKVALANKESVVCGGNLIEEALSCGGSVVPVDSEHSSLFQCLLDHSRQEVAKLVLTASGGPFLSSPLDMLDDVTPEQAVRHPRWNMGAKISVDSATMMNKALEVIEAHWLFGVSPIEVVVHPESIVHGLVALSDGSMLAHMSMPDMKVPIAYGMLFPDLRLPGVLPQLSLAEVGRLTFMELDHERFPAVRLAQRCLTANDSSSAVLNLANEIAVEAFLRGRIGFTSIVRVSEAFLDEFTLSTCTTIDELRILIERIRSKSEELLLPFLKC